MIYFGKKSMHWDSSLPSAGHNRGIHLTWWAWLKGALHGVNNLVHRLKLMYTEGLLHNFAKFLSYISPCFASILLSRYLSACFGYYFCRVFSFRSSQLAQWKMLLQALCYTAKVPTNWAPPESCYSSLTTYTISSAWFVLKVC